MRVTQRWQDFATLLLGLWLIASPRLMGTAWTGGFDLAHAGSDLWSGIIVFVISLVLLSFPRFIAAEVINMIVGLWVFLSPWLLGFTERSRAAWNAWVVGALVVLLALWAFQTMRRRLNAAL